MPWQAGPVTDTTDLVQDWLSLPEVAAALGVEIPQVRQLVRDRKLLARNRDGDLAVPAAFVQEGRVLKGLPGLLTVLTDGGFSDDEALGWLFTVDDSLPGSPVEALRQNRGTEVRRRAQALGF